MAEKSSLRDPRDGAIKVIKAENSEAQTWDIAWDGEHIVIKAQIYHAA